jgi:hypothetical protein
MPESWVYDMMEEGDVGLGIRMNKYESINITSEYVWDIVL